MLYWVCKKCIGDIDFEGYPIGHFGKVSCEVCGKEFFRPNIAFVGHGTFMKAKEIADNAKH